ncbi:MAG: XRE family transcriptional regulator [Candidatus Omnitrophota bacterium]|jgi:DNA-binding XRE family transcriptional regulator|nr:MAG: XRE family transcriptional regulator [Candidatus Omnitrophota bacterium]
MIRKLKSVREHLDEKLKDPYFRELYELEQERMKISRLFIDYRAKNNLTQEELASKLGISQQYISKLEEGIFSNIRDVAKILLAIGYKIEFKIINIPSKISKIIRNKLQVA